MLPWATLSGATSQRMPLMLVSSGQLERMMILSCHVLIGLCFPSGQAKTAKASIRNLPHCYVPSQS